MKYWFIAILLELSGPGRMILISFKFDNLIGLRCIKFDFLEVTNKLISLETNDTFNPVGFLTEGTIANSNLLDLTISSNTPE